MTAPGGTSPLPTRRFQRARIGLVLLVIALGAIATWAAYGRSEAELARKDRVVARQATDLIDAIMTSTEAGLGGAGGVIEPDGTVDVEAFDAYGNGVVAATTLNALAYEAVVPEADRAAFEASVGRPIIDRPGPSASVAPARPVHYPVVRVVPMMDTTSAVLGFDLAGDPVRWAAAQLARDRGTLIFSEPTGSQPSGRLSFFLVRALYRPGAPVETVTQRQAAVVGFVSTAYGADILGGELSGAMPRGARFRVTDGTALLAQSDRPVHGGATRAVTVASRDWTIRVSAGTTANRSVTILLACITAILASGLGFLLHRTKRFDEAVERSADHLQALARFAGGLATRGTSDDVMTYLTSAVLAPLDGFHAAVGVVEGDQLRRYFTPGTLSEVAMQALPTTNPLSADTPLTQAVRTDEWVLLPSTATMSGTYPHLVDAWQAAGFGATANVPLHDRRGTVIGALGVAWERPVGFDADLLGRLATVAGIAGQTLERAQQGDAEHRLVNALQSDVLAPLPPAEHLACAARYLPAARKVGMGGDWFEGIELDEGRYVVVVGDIAGHGITAVGQMAQFRSMIGTLVRLGTPIDQLIERASRSVEGTGRIATALVVEIDPVRGRLSYVAAGHPPPVLRLPDGQVVALADGRRPLIGVTKRSTPAGEADFPIGATLVCYTDGLIERRTETIDRSVQHLVERVARLEAGDPERMADELLAGSLLPEAEQTDDVALAVITRRS